VTIQIEHTELSEKVYQVLKKMILNREFVGGQKLDLNELSQQMKISRTPLKDAVNRLVAEGLMEVKPRSGTFVTQIRSDDIKHIMEMRLMIELWCVSSLGEQSVGMLAKQLRANIRRSGKLLAEADYSYEGFLEIDVEFHTAIVASAQNPKMMEVYKSLNSFLKISRVFYFKSYERSLLGQEEHEQIVTCLEEGNLDLSKEALKAHIESSRLVMVSLLEENGGSI